MDGHRRRAVQVVVGTAGSGVGLQFQSLSGRRPSCWWRSNESPKMNVLGVFENGSCDAGPDSRPHIGHLAQLVARTLRIQDCVRSWVQLPQCPYFLPFIRGPAVFLFPKYTRLVADIAQDSVKSQLNLVL